MKIDQLFRLTIWLMLLENIVTGTNIHIPFILWSKNKTNGSKKHKQYNGKAKRTNNDLQNTAQKTKGPNNMDPTKNRRWTHVPMKSKQLLLHIWHSRVLLLLSQTRRLAMND